MVSATAPGHVVVVGAGIIGLSTAWYLQEQGVKVTVVDRGEVASGSSWGNAGWLTPALTLPLSEPSVLSYGLKAILDPASPLYIPFSTDPLLLKFLLGFARNCTPGKWRAAMKIFAELGRSGIDAFQELAEGTPALAEPTHLADPFLTGFASLKDRDALVKEFHVIRETGGHVDFTLMSGEEIRHLEPALGAGVAAGIAIRDQRFIDPPNFMASLAEAVIARGATVTTAFTVLDVRDTGSGVEVIGSAGRSLIADAVVLATGAWLGTLARKFGVKRVVQAGRGYSFTVVPEAIPTHPIYFPAQRVACTPLGNRLRVAGMMEFRNADAPLDARRIKAIVDAASPMFTGINWDDRAEEWVGSRPCTTDGFPLVGATRSPRVHVAGGHGMWGIALGPLTGKMVAAELTSNTPPASMRHFNPLR
ncbi:MULTISPECIES: NAD(P)/FAD-dependent oxidoreductase [Arthrobacter]|uniref:Amino acid dehydrogenase n=1 Tax=Arthrobacter psychrochitiniphilus TaxID=291045 RepID=A0A2V3DV87_9MICC|nr:MULTISPECIES: FAD-dependent oxidoreductase [Arthrobacter]NYG15720.1 D-amino-acid dehydrogenase [Arthrobacter psychrochitiniphilus]PXA66814.1 amino acid dehydrogenase [Arthrobacter psychrochitiniphilus]